MKKELQELKPLKGLGTLKFGMTRSEVRALLGEAEYIDELSFSGEPEDQSEAWHYDDLDLSMSFDAGDDWRLITIAVSSEYYQWAGQGLVGMSRAELLPFLEKQDAGEMEMESGAELDMPENMEVIFLNALFMNFWLEDGVVKEVQWSPEFTDDDEVVWPG